jgi:hypothetical protein
VKGRILFHLPVGKWRVLAGLNLEREIAAGSHNELKWQLLPSYTQSLLIRLPGVNFSAPSFFCTFSKHLETR